MKEIAPVLNSNRDSDETVANAGGLQIVGRYFRMSRCSWVARQCLYSAEAHRVFRDR